LYPFYRLHRYFQQRRLQRLPIRLALNESIIRKGADVYVRDTRHSLIESVAQVTLGRWSAENPVHGMCFLAYDLFETSAGTAIVRLHSHSPDQPCGFEVPEGSFKIDMPAGHLFFTAIERRTEPTDLKSTFRNFLISSIT